MSRQFQPGDPALLRYVWNGKVSDADAVTVVVDSKDFLALYLAAGNPRKIPTSSDGKVDRWAGTLPDHGHTDGTWRNNNVLILIKHDVPYASWLFREAQTNKLLGWYINLQDPIRRTPIGFDTRDHILDIVIPVEQPWYWKDEDELAFTVSNGLLSHEEATAIRDAGELAMKEYELGSFPYKDGWENWLPDPVWQRPTMPAGWDQL